MSRLVLAAVALAALSLLGPAAPAYDPWAWLLWGRELTEGTLSTEEGPAFKPLPVLVTTPLALLGDDVAPLAWVLVGRAGAVLAVLLAGALAWREAGPPAGAAAGAAVAGLEGWLWHGAVGNAEGLLAALALAAVGCHRDGRHRAALALGIAAALVRVEAWPFLLAYALWRRDRAGWAVAVVPLLWFGPELAGSGDLLRSGERAQVPNPGQPATADVPALASLSEAVLIASPLLLLARGRLALAGLAWIAVVAGMAQVLGTSGEARYHLPGLALLAVPASVRLSAAIRGRITHRTAAGVLLLATVVLGAVRAADEAPRVADEAELWGSLGTLVERTGRDALLRCGPVGTGRYRGTAVAYALRVPKREVVTPGTGATTLRSRLRRGAPVEPRAAGRVLARTSRWEARTTC